MKSLIVIVAFSLISAYFSCSSARKSENPLPPRTKSNSPTEVPTPKMKTNTLQLFEGAFVYGLRVGISTEKDINKLYGFPKSETEPEEKTFPSSRESEIELTYTNVDSFDGTVVFTIEKHSRRLISVLSYPDRLFPIENIIAKNGNRYLIVDTNSWCDVISDYGAKIPDGEQTIAYPEDGTFYALNSDHDVRMIQTSVRCE